jgi:phage/plasmid-like protein (TIGR03299 family)
MAHNLNINKGRTSFFSVKEKAWHGLGQILENCPTSEEAIKYAGLDFEIEKRPLFTTVGDMVSSDKSKQLDIALRRNTGIFKSKELSQKVLVRNDTESVFGIVSDRYEIVQNTKAFEFFDNIVGEGEAIYETAGALHNGEVIFITAKLPDYIQVKDDCIDKYLVLTNSHDGKSPIKVLFTPIRVVCNNTLNAALGSSKHQITIRHTGNIDVKLQQAAQLLGITNKLTNELTEIFEGMTKAKVDDTQLVQFICKSLNLVPGEDGKLSTRSYNVLESVLEYNEIGAGQQYDYMKGTVYGAYNAVTGYLQNVKNYKSEEDKMESIIMDGKGETAFSLALSYLN